MQLVLVAGFLGSGKTTFVLNLARVAAASGRRVAILVNEIGEVGIDDQLMRRLGFNVWELLAGCICCTLSGNLVAALQMLGAQYAPDLVLLEPSGAAEPGRILSALPYYRGQPLASVRTIVLLDPQRLPVLLEVLTPLVTAQIEHADVVIVNKTDAATPAEIEAARQAAARINPRAPLLALSARQALGPEALAEVLACSP